MINNHKTLPAQQPVSRSRWGGGQTLCWWIGALTLLCVAWLISWALLPHIAQATPNDPITSAWEAARTVGSYAFTTDIRQVTIPSARITNVGRSSKSQMLHLEGKTDLQQALLEMTLWTDGGNTAQPNSGVGIKVVDGQSYTRQGAGEWQATDNLLDGIAPGGDFLGFLTAVQEVQVVGTEQRAGISFTRYRFTLDGPTLAAYMREQTEAALRQKGELPPGVSLESSQYYRDMVGDGELWVRSDGLPLRQVLNLQFPEQRDEYVNAQITTDFSGFDSAAPVADWGSKQWSAVSEQFATGSAAIPLTLLAGLGLLFVVIRYRHTRRLYNGLAIAVILSMVIGPALTTTLNVRFLDAQSAKAATQQQSELQNDITQEMRAQLGDPEFNPHQNPMESGEENVEIERLRDWEIGSQSPNLPISQSLNLQSTDNGADTDTDGLTDFQEQRIGTDAKFADSDEDGVNDNLEVRGFALGGQTWYANPLESDSNRDGIADTVEFDNDGNGSPDDTDSDNIPDLFDFDNDNDGVPDNKDSAPFAFTSAGANTPFSEAAPLKLTVNNVAAGKPTFVDFQLRPTDPKRLWYAFNVLDWPSDSEAQMQDIDGVTFAQTGGTAANDANGDLKLIPMLEIRIHGATTNLPTQAELTPYNITVNNFSADGSIKTVMVPLNVITDEKTGERVAFSGRMLYLPGGSWPSAHDVRLSWVVMGLSDVRCDKATDKSPDCQADGRLNNRSVPLQTYYDSFTLTGLSVQEDNGSSVAIIYEDPAVDPNPKDDTALVALSHGLDNSFLGGRDQDGNNQRDVTLDEIVRRFERTGNGGVSTIERWSVPNVLRVEKASYATNDRALITTAMTETKRILNHVFSPAWQTDKQIKPLLMYAQEQTLRALDFDAIRTPGGYVTANAGAITFDFQPSGQEPVTRDTMASLKWTPYCAPNTSALDASTPTWDVCANDVYWSELAVRYRSNNGGGNPDTAAGRLAATQLYFLAMIGSVARIVQRDVRVVSGRYTLKTDTEIERYVRTASLVIGEIVAEIASTAVMARFVNKETMLQALGREVKEIFEGKIGQLGKDAVDILRSFRDGGNYNRAASTGIVVGAAAVLGGLVTGAYFLVDAYLSSDLEANLGAQITVRILIAAVTIYLTAIVPLKAVYEWHEAYKAAGVPLRLTSTIGTAAAKATAIGVIVPVALTWGFFIYSMVSGQVSAFSPEFNKPFAEAIATTLYVIFLFVFSLTIIGTIIVAIIAIIDTILTAICVLGVDALRTVPGLGGACFTLGTAAIKVLAYLLYNFDPMVNTERDDLVVAGVPKVTLADPNKGYIAGQTLSVQLPVTTTVVHKDPDPANGLMIFFYLYLYSPNNLRQSSFRYSLTQNATPLTVAGGQMVNEWQGVREDHKFVLTPMYRGQKADNPTPLNGLTLQAGLDKTVPFHLNMGYAVPGYECWLIILVPVCYTRKDGLVGNNSTPINALKYDVFPATLDGFMSLTNRDGGLALAWDNRFPTLADVDGDGLLVNSRNGLDPNDALPDADGDGLSDAFELERRQAGIALSPILRDSDSDGLTDKQEMEFGTNAGVADSDNDGLRDGEELWHQVYDANGAPTATFAGGWEVTINGASTIPQRVSSNPNQADGDADGVSDQAERQLAQDANPANRLDNQNRPYHPNVPNAPPLAVYAASDDADGFVRPGQPLIYTTTVVANVAVAPGVLQVTTPPQLGAALAPYALAFNPATFNISQTVTQQSNLMVAGNAGVGALNLSSTALVRLPNTAAPAWIFDPVVAEAPLGGFVDPFKARFHSLNPSRVDRQDSYFLSGLVGPSAGEFDLGNIRTYGLPAGTAQVAEDTVPNSAPFFLRGFTAPDSAINNRNDSLVVWDRIDRCNTITINSLRVVTAGGDASPGIEPFITLATNNTSKNENVWLWTTGGGSGEMTANQQRGPNAFGFPLTRTICDDTRLKVYESDGPLTNPAQQQLVAEIVTDPFIDRNNQTLTFTGAGHTIEVNVTVPVRDAFVIGGALVGPDGLPKRSISLSRPTGLTVNYKTVSRSPAVASNGNGFLVAYETYAEPFTPPGNNPPLPRDVYVAVQAFDGAGNLLGSSVRFVATQNPTQNIATRSGIDVAWVGDRYKVVVQPWGREWIVAGDFSASGASLGNWSNVDNLFGNTTQTSPPSIAYNPTNGRWAVSYVRSPSVIGTAVRIVEYANGGNMTETANQVIVGTFKQARIAYHPPSRGWLVAGLDDGNQLRFQPFQPGLTDLTASQTGLAGASTVDSSLACPAPQSVPTIDLRFEELPGTTSFADSSGGNNNATCTGASCPAAGVGGAPNAPLSDYAAQFDGGDDFLTVNRSVPDDFTIAFWFKPSDLRAEALLIDQGANVDGGFAVGLMGGELTLSLNTNEMLRSPGIPIDGGWRFAAVTRNRSTGLVAIYEDGANTPKVTQTFATTALNAVTNIRIGGDRSGNRDFSGTLDHLQIFPTVLDSNAIQAIYNRTQQSYCVAAHANAAQSGFQWAKLSIRQQDVRGGRITASSALSLTVDADVPSVSIKLPLDQDFIYIQGGNPRVTIIGGNANDLTSGVGKVEVNINNSGWQLATGKEAWSYPLVVTEGSYTLFARATDAVGNLGKETGRDLAGDSAPFIIIADATAPNLTLNDLGATPMRPTRNQAGQWTVNLAGTVSDPAIAGGQLGSGLAASGVEVLVESSVSGSLPDSRQTAVIADNTWSLAYVLNDVADPTGIYTVTVTTLDNVGNRTADVRGQLKLDAAAPLVSLSDSDVSRTVISSTVTISGLVTDTATIPGSSAGIDQVEIAFTPAEQLIALPAGVVGEAAEALLDRPWVPVTLAQRGAGVATSPWSYQLPTGLEGEYQIDFRSTDMLGNRRITPNYWRGLIDTTAPRVTMAVDVTGASFVEKSGVRRYEVRFTCAATDRNLDEATFDCPGKGQAEPTRAFAKLPGLQGLFPDLTILNDLSLFYVLWSSTPTPEATVRACDSLGHCASASAVGTAPPVAELPQAVIIAPTYNSFVAATNGISVTVAAESAAALKEVTIELDFAVVQTLTFAQNEGVTNIQRTVTIPVAEEGPHTLITRATDWTGATRSSQPVVFSVDGALPSLTLDTSPLTVADTWQPGSGILRFHGTVNDALGVVAVQVSVDGGAFVDASFGDGVWQTALHVQDPEGRTLTVTVRATDHAGQVTAITQPIGTDFSAADAPETTIDSGPGLGLATFGFTGTANAVAFDCQLDDGAYLPCVSPATYADLSKGEHSFRVRAIDERGFVDLTPAHVVWTVVAGALDVTVTGKPSDPTTSRSAQFVFSGNAPGFECSLDGAPFLPCSSGQSYANLAYGSHTFLVRGRDGNTVGASDRFQWKVQNEAPVAAGQMLTTSANVPLPITLNASDVDALTYEVITAPAHGVLLGAAPSLTYVPDSNYTGADSFTFSANDGLASAAPATIQITVQPGTGTGSSVIFLPLVAR